MPPVDADRVELVAVRVHEHAVVGRDWVGCAHDLVAAREGGG